MRELIHLFKYGKVAPLSGVLGAYLLRSLPRDEAVDLLTPVPLHWRRRWDRGFNQSELLARVVSRSTGIPMRGVLRRERATAVQAGLSHTERRRNVARAFRCHRPHEVRGKRIVLVDDVMTTGSTATACARALKAAGAARVVLLTVARADRRPAAKHVVRDDLWVEENVRNDQ